MNEEKKLEVALDCLRKARNYFKDENYYRAFPHYLMCLELLPSERNTCKEEFIQLLFMLGNRLESEGSHDYLFDSYEKALHYFPSEFHVLNNYGAHLLRLDYPERALTYFERAHKASPSNLLAEKNFQTCKVAVIPRWHFSMLNDLKRNSAYRAAIHSEISKLDVARVIDIGAGCGLLSYYVSECKNVEKTVAVESNPVLGGIARNLLKEAQIICEQSTRLTGSDAEASNLIVTEIFDAGLFGEHALETLIHAWDNLASPSAKIIPSSADLFVAGINCDSIFRQHKVMHGERHGLKLDGLCITQIRDEPYVAEDLKGVAVSFMTGTTTVLNVRFDDVERLRDLHENKRAIPEVKLRCTKRGFIQAFAFYFDLNLNSENKVTTNPNEDNLTCWEQAIIYLDHPLEVVENEEVSLSVSCVGGKLEVTPNSNTLCRQCFSISQQSVAFLNDARLCAVSQNINLHSNKRVIDLNPFPIFALQQACRHRSGEYIVLVKTADDYVLLNDVLRSNGLVSSFKIYHQLEDLCSAIEISSVDAIFINPVSINGTLCEETLDNLEMLKQFLRSDGEILPRQIKMVMELIESDYLDYCNKIDEEKTIGFKVGQAMNEYAISEQWQVQSETYRRKILSTDVCNFSYFSQNAELISDTYNFKVTSGGTANGILCSYDLIFSDDIHLETINSFYYKEMCYVFDDVYTVKENDVFTIHLKQENGLIKINVAT